MYKIPLILLGGGGHCKSCIDVIEAEDKYSIKGIIDAHLTTDSTILGYTVMGGDELIPSLVKQGYTFLITVGQIKSAAIRERLFNQLIALNAKIATVVSPNAYISKHTQIGVGTIVMHGVMINSSVTIGQNTILNTKSLLEHDVSVGSHTHISTGATINGSVTIGERVFVGSNATIANNISLGNDIVIGAGSVVIQSIINQGTYVGNPCSVIK